MTCTNTITISKTKLEKALFDELTSRLLTPVCVDFFVQEFRQAFKDEVGNGAADSKIEKLEAEVLTQEGRIKRLVDFLASGEQSTAVAVTLREEEEKLKNLYRDLANLKSDRQQFFPPPTKAIKNELERLRAAINGHDPTAAKATLKALIGELKLTPVETTADGEDELPEPPEPSGPQKKRSRSLWNYQVTGSLYLQNLLIPVEGVPVRPSVVAGAGFEPATFGL